MKFAIVIMAVMAAASAQTSPSPFNPFGNQRQYNPYQPYSPYQQQYNPYNRYTTPAPYRPFSSTTPAPFVFAPSTVAPPAPTALPVASKIYNYGESKNAEIIKYNNEIYPDGSYSYDYQTSNGIAAQIQGTPRNFGGNPPVVPDVAQGSFSWVTPEGRQIVITFVADENGYQPSGDAIPTPHPIPEAILRSIEYNLKNPQKN